MVATLGSTLVGVSAGCSENSAPGNGSGGDSDNFEQGNSHSYSGSGSEETERFELITGLLHYQYEANGESVFHSETQYFGDETNPRPNSRNLTNYLGPVEGELMSVVDEGEYLIRTDAEGEWSVTINQPALDEENAQTTPVEKSGTGNTFFGPVELNEGDEIFAENEGEGVFMVDTITKDGLWDVPVNEGGTTEVSGPLRDTGIAHVNVVGGDWTVRLE